MRIRRLLLTIVLIVAVDSTAYTKPHGSMDCYWVDGRLRAYNGNPSFRIWPRGTNRLLGVSDWEQNELSEIFPPNLVKLKPFLGRDVWGSFHVCPLDKERAGWMRLVKVTAARRLIVVTN